MSWKYLCTFDSLNSLDSCVTLHKANEKQAVFISLQIFNIGEFHRRVLPPQILNPVPEFSSHTISNDFLNRGINWGFCRHVSELKDEDVFTLGPAFPGTPTCPCEDMTWFNGLRKMN